MTFVMAMVAVVELRAVSLFWAYILLYTARELSSEREKALF